MSFTVWTVTRNEKLIDRNAGVDEFIVCSNIKYKQSASSMVDRLNDLYGDREAYYVED